jgi:hypothetical protein
VSACVRARARVRACVRALTESFWCACRMFCKAFQPTSWFLALWHLLHQPFVTACTHRWCVFLLRRMMRSLPLIFWLSTVTAPSGCTRVPEGLCTDCSAVRSVLVPLCLVRPITKADCKLLPVWEGHCAVAHLGKPQCPTQSLTTLSFFP